MKKRKRIRIFGVPLKAEPGDRPEDAPAWFKKWWGKYIGPALFHIFMVSLILNFYLWFGVLPAWYAQQQADQEIQAKAMSWSR